jgi:hypothetical protein
MLPHGSVISAGAFCSGFSSKVAEGAIGDGVSSGRATTRASVSGMEWLRGVDDGNRHVAH